MATFDAIEYEKRFNELIHAWMNDEITYEQLHKAWYNKWTLDQLLWWENSSLWEKIKTLFGK